MDSFSEWKGSAATAGRGPGWRSPQEGARAWRQDVAVSASHYRTENQVSCKKIMKEVMKRRKERENGVRSGIV